MSRSATNFNEIVVLLARNEASGDREQRDARDIEYDLQRLLLLTRDATQRDQMIQAQAVRRIATIAQQASSSHGWGVQRCCAAILCNLAHSARARLSASSCDRWHCVSHRHNCPLARLLQQAVTTGPTTDVCLRQLSAAALLSFSIQNECQTQLDLLGALPQLLHGLQDARDDADVRVFVAATLWNLTKSPLLLLKLETVHGMLKDRLTRTLTDVLWTPLDGFQLAITPTGERGTTGLLESDSVDNLGVMLVASTSTQLSVVLHIENYIGRARSLADQYRPRTPLLGRAARQRDPSVVVEGHSVSHFDESGVLRSRTCAVCDKKIKVVARKRRRKPPTATGDARAVQPLHLPYLACVRDGCEQTFHTTCSRWKALAPERLTAYVHDFYCAGCLVHVGVVTYCDFLAEHAQHEWLLTETRFKSVGLQRVATATAGTSPLLPGAACRESGGVAYVALLDKQTKDVVAVGVKTYRVPASSQDPEMFVVSVRYVRLAAYAATQQTSATATQRNNRTPSPSPSSPDGVAVKNEWNVSYAREGASQVHVTPGSVVFWPGPFLQDLDVSLYTLQSLADLDTVFLYEFQGETAVDRAYSFGRAIPSRDSSLSTQAPSLWSTLFPRKGVCMKLLAEQIGHHKQLHELLGSGHRATTTTAVTSTTSAPSKQPTKKAMRKPLLAIGRKLSRVAVATGT